MVDVHQCQSRRLNLSTPSFKPFQITLLWNTLELTCVSLSPGINGAGCKDTISTKLFIVKDLNISLHSSVCQMYIDQNTLVFFSFYNDYRNIMLFIDVHIYLILIVWICEFQYNRGRASNRSSWVFGMPWQKEAYFEDCESPYGQSSNAPYQETRSAWKLDNIRWVEVLPPSSGWGFQSPDSQPPRMFCWPHHRCTHTECGSLGCLQVHNMETERQPHSKNLLRDHLDVIEWTYWRGNHHKYGPLGMLLHDIRKKYPC